MLSEKNASYERDQYRSTLGKRSNGQERLLEQLKQDFRLKELPVHIECFDNSNFQGSSPVSSMVVFKNARPAKKEYRHYNIKTVVGPDDFASMEEVVHRRYKRLSEEEQPLPQLVVIDGGKGQLSSALKAVNDLGLQGEMTIVGIAKRLEEIFYPGDTLPMYIDKRSESLKVIQQLRNEAHRFAITFHRLKRDKASMAMKIYEIKGIGKKTADLLLQKLRSEKKIKQATQEQLALIIGPAKAKIVHSFYHTDQ